jgi:hypothetical protein
MGTEKGEEGAKREIMRKKNMGALGAESGREGREEGTQKGEIRERGNIEEEETERGCRKQKRYRNRMQRMLQRIKKNYNSL